MIKRVWSRLETYEVSTPKNRYATSCSSVSAIPRRRSTSSPQKLGEQIGARRHPRSLPQDTRNEPAPSSSNCSIQELRETIHPAEPEDIEAEIYDLGLGNLYRRYSPKSERLTTDRCRTSRPAPDASCYRSLPHFTSCCALRKFPRAP